MKILLFDIDGTLINSGGAGIHAMNVAFAEVFGVHHALGGLMLAGRTDALIVEDALARSRLTVDDERLMCLRARYYKILPGVLDGITEGKRVLPGVQPLLERLSARTDVFLGLLTGNFSEAARIKLEYFDLWKYFACGAYGDDRRDRNGLVSVALERARLLGAIHSRPTDVLVIGDTPLDVACALAANARAIGVATGPYTAHQLRESGAEVVFDDLSEVDRFLELLED